MADLKTPLLDELEKGPWPSFVKDMKRLVDRKPAVRDVLGILETSYREKRTADQGGRLVDRP
jgi:sulfite reductase alpha subunit